MLNHSSAKSGQRTANSEQVAAGTAKRAKNRTGNNNCTNKTISNALKRRNGTSKKTDKESVPGAVATGSQVAKNTLTPSGRSKTTISKALRRRAQSVIKDRSIDAQSRALIRYALETNDPWLPELVRRAEAGETIIYTVNSLKHPHPARRIQAKQRLKH